MDKLKPCPFCGGQAELFTDRTFPVKRKMLCESRQVAENLLAQWEKNGIVVESDIWPRNHYKTGKPKWGCVVVYRAYIPRCRSEKCLCRNNSIMFRFEEEAIEAWNRRAGE